MQEQNLYDTIYQIYLNNLNYLEEKFPRVFQKVAIFSHALDNGEYDAKYELEYDEKQDYFNIYDIENKTFLYNGNSFEISDTITKNSSYSKDDAYNLLSINFNTNKLQLGTFVKDLNPIKNIINDDIDFTNYEYIKIYKYMFMGSGLGLHIKSTVDKFNPNSILIIEPNIEIFRLSLFITDYSVIAQNTEIFMSIAQHRNQRNVVAQIFYSYQPYLNYTIKYTLFNKEYENLLGDIFKKFMQNHSEAFSYTPQLIGISRTIKRVKEEYKFLDLYGLRKTDLFDDKPTLIVGAGPSSKKNIDWIIKNQKKYFIVCVSTMVPFFIENNIKPDIVTVIDYNDIISKFFENDGLKEFLKDTPIIMPTQVSEKVIGYLEKNNIRMLQTYNMYEDLSPAFITSNVGAYSLKVMAVIKAKNIYCLGIDCAFDQDTGEMHSSNKVVTKSFDTKNLSNKIKVKGNLRDTVYTTDELLSYKNDFESVALMFEKDKEYSFYNLCDGAYIEGIEPLDIQEIDNKSLSTFDKMTIKQGILDRSLLAKNVSFIDDLNLMLGIEKKLKNYKKVQVINRDFFIQEQIELLLSILDITKQMSIPTFAKLFMEFIEVSGIYLYFYINVRGEHLGNKKKLQNIKKAWVDMGLKVLKDIEISFTKAQGD